jgi:hypothetical protein
MSTVLKSAATLFVMFCILLQASVSFAQKDFVIIDPKLQAKKIDLQSLNDLNRDSAQLNLQQKKDSFKLYILSAPFEGQLNLQVDGAKPLISGRFDNELLKAVAQLMIEEMDTIDQLSPFSLASAMINAPKWDVSEVWDCLWMQLLLPGSAGGSEYVNVCSAKLSSKSGLSEEKSLQLVTSMATGYRTLSFFNVLYGQARIGEANSEIFTRLATRADSFYRKFVRSEGLVNFRQTFANGVYKMGAQTETQKKMYNRAIEMLRQAKAANQTETLEVYRKTFSEYGIFIPEDLLEEKK